MTNDIRIDFDKINDSIYNNFEQISDVFGLELRQDKQDWVGVCPLHEGADNPTAFRVFGDTASFWCFSHKCGNENKNGLLDLLKLLIEKQQCIECDFNYVLAWYSSQILDNKDIKLIPKSVKKKANHIHISKVYFENKEEWRQFSDYPSEKYIKLGFRSDIVERMGIGECHDKTNRLYNRIVVPQFNRDGAVVGVTGRSLYPKCLRCKLYHSPSAPCPTENLGYHAKWKHHYGFKTSNYLYNFWTIPDGIREILVVESVGNTLRAIEAEYRNTVGCFGAGLTKRQANLLAEFGIRRINYICDNDENKAGLNAAMKTKQQYEEKEKMFSVRILSPPGVNDIAEMNSDELKQWLLLKDVTT